MIGRDDGGVREMPIPTSIFSQIEINRRRNSHEHVFLAVSGSERFLGMIDYRTTDAARAEFKWDGGSGSETGSRIAGRRER